jgi:alpha-L-fucosidase 2
MIFSGCPVERVQFNEQTLWTGAEGTQKWLDASRSNERTRDGAIGAYQPFGDLTLELPADHANASEFSRELDLSTGVVTTRYRVGNVLHTRQAFASHAAGVIVVRLTADKGASVSLRVALRDAKRPPMEPARTVVAGHRMSFSGAFTRPRSVPETARQYNGMQYTAAVDAVAEGGKVEAENDELVVTGADSVTLLLAAGTSYVAEPARGYRGDPPGPHVETLLAAAGARPFEQLLAEHVSEHKALLNRVALELPVTPSSALPTNRRLEEYAKGSTDPALEALLFQFGRYLLVSSSRPGGLPANLQGLWNDNPAPAWYSGYTTNINLEMNYWLAETTNLPECSRPLFDYIDHLAADQKANPDPKLRTELGWIIYSTNNPLGGNSGWGIHLPGSAWLSQHLYESWAFSGDKTFLRDRAYPHLRELARMWDARLITNSEGKLITPDGWSPEHGPVRDAAGKLTIREGDRTPQPGASYDQFIIHDLFSNFIDASTELGVDEELREHIRQRRDHLLGPQVGRWGQLQEWMQDVDDPKDRHRHVSHLFALHPGRQISPLLTPALAAAARVTLAARGDESVGWSRAWKMNHWARLGDGNHAHDIARGFLGYSATDRPDTRSRRDAYEGGILPNLFCDGPPFQIDGNFGFTSGIAEILLQSHLRTPDGRRILQLLPALPDAWPSGSVRGLRARDGFTVDIKWANGQLIKATIHSHLGKPFQTYYRDTAIDRKLAAGATLELP